MFSGRRRGTGKYELVESETSTPRDEQPEEPPPRSSSDAHR